MIRALIAPRRYMQGAGILSDAGKYIEPLGKRALVIWDETVRGVIGEQLKKSFAEHGVELTEFVFSGECSRNQANIGIEKVKESGAEVVIGAGGGKAIDTAKAVAFPAGAKMVSLATIASNDAPTSSATVFYTDDGVLDGIGVWSGNPDLVLVDTQVVAEAPIRWLASGIGDALATWFEADAAFKARRVAFAGGVPTMTAMALARLCYDTLMEYGRSAMEDAKSHVVTPELERVVEANILLSGLGWESGGLATAHTLGNSLTVVPSTHHFSHGEKVAFGVATQLCLDDQVDIEERQRVFDFLIDVGLPVTFDNIGLEKLSKDELMDLAKVLTKEGEFVHNHVFPVGAYDLYSAMVAADHLGHQRMALRGNGH